MEEKLMEWRLLMELRDEEAEGLKRMALEHGTTVAGMLEGFLRDLTGSSGSNGKEAEKLAKAWMGYKHGTANEDGTFEAWLAGCGMMDEAVRACREIEWLSRRILNATEEIEGGYKLVMGERVPWYLCDEYGYDYDTIEEWKDMRQKEIQNLQDGVAREREAFKELWNAYKRSGWPPHIDMGKEQTPPFSTAGQKDGEWDGAMADKAASIARWQRNTNHGMALKSFPRHVPIRNWKREGRYGAERELTVEISYEANRRLREAAFRCGVTVPRLLESFVHDLLEDNVILADWKRCAMSEGFSWYLAREGWLEKAIRSYGKVVSCEERISLLEDAIADGMDGDVPWTACEDWNGNRYQSREAWNSDLQKDIKTLRGQLADSWKFLNQQWNDYRMSPQFRQGETPLMAQMAKMAETSDKVARELEPIEAKMVGKRERMPIKRLERMPSL